MQTTSVNGVDIAYRIDGSPNHPWLVLSNSLAADHRMWTPQMEAFTRTHRVLRYDTRGHGESQATEGPYSFNMLVTDLVGLMDDLDIDRADVVGLSLGGMTALGLALDHPTRVSRLICCDARADAPAPYADGWRQRIAVVREEGLAAIADGTIDRWLTDKFRADPDSKTTIDLARDMILTTTIDGFCGCAAALTQLDYAPRLGEVLAPTLCVVGSDDVAAPPAVMAAMVKAIPDAELVVIDGAAHVANMNNPKAFNRLVEKWL